MGLGWTVRLPEVGKKHGGTHYKDSIWNGSKFSVSNNIDCNLPIFFAGKQEYHIFDMVKNTFSDKWQNSFVIYFLVFFFVVKKLYMQHLLNRHGEAWEYKEFFWPYLFDLFSLLERFLGF